MAILTINDNPSVSDTIVFTLLTPDANGCFTSNPYVVNKVTIYYVERDFSSGNISEYDNSTYNLSTLQAAVTAQALACSNPTDENIAAAQVAQVAANSTAVVTPFYFNEAVPVEIVGNDSYPAWLSTDINNALIDLVTEDSDGNTVYGQYTYTWQPQGREGDYFICWTWTPLSAGSSLSSHAKFYLAGNTINNTSIPTHYTDPAKYTTLLERYTPEMFKMLISNNDQTPSVIDNFNSAIASGFNVLEDLTNQIVDLQDANVLSEPLLPYLSNFFNLKLKTTDPIRWRGQIKRAVPLFKSKGTKKGLMEGLEHAAIKLLGINQLWQAISPYTWQDSFTYEGNDEPFILSKVALPVEYENFALWIRPPDSDWVSLNLDYIDFNTYEGVTTVSWVGSGLSIDPIDLIVGDEIRILYKYNYIPDDDAQTIENYIRTLPLIDQRDERNQIFPLKNWNVRGIQENDPMFDLVIPTRHPLADPVIFGQIRTEFPYSENVFNMDEYNGSLRNSTVPCDIDRNFLDPCSGGLSSSYNIDLEIENLCDDRIEEAKEVLTECMPFHAVLNNFNFIGSVHEFVESPIEEIHCLVSIQGNEYVIAGDAQTWFNRIMQSVETEGITRAELASKTVALSATTGVAYNDEIVVFCPTTKLDQVGMDIAEAELHILSPSPLAGIYSASNPNNNVVTIDLTSGNPTPDSEPINNCNNLFANNDTINSCAFTFDINNVVLNGTLCNIAQDNVYIFSDVNQNFGILSAQSSFDVTQGTATQAWKIHAFSNYYTIKDILPNGNLIIANNGTLPGNTSNVSYTLVDGNNIVKMTSTTGNLQANLQGTVTCLNSTILPIYNVITDTESFYCIVSNNEYQIVGFNGNNQFFISGYNLGGMGSVNLKVNKKVIKQEVGYFTHRGLKLKMSGNLESSLGIQNGANSLVVVDDGIENSGFKENFIIVIGSDSYFIADINGGNPVGYTTITLSGTDNYWKTLGAGGTSVSATIYKYQKLGATIPGQQFDLPEHTFRTLSRSGSPIIDRTDENGEVTGLSFGSGAQITEFVQQTESISFRIEYADGTFEEGEL